MGNTGLLLQTGMTGHGSKLMSWKLRMVSSRVNNHMTNNTQPGEKFQEFSPTLIAWCMNDWVIHKPGNNDGE